MIGRRMAAMFAGLGVLLGVRKAPSTDAPASPAVPAPVAPVPWAAAAPDQPRITRAPRQRIKGAPQPAGAKLARKAARGKL